MGKRGSFSERLEKALSVGQTVTITRHGSENEGESDYYEIVAEYQSAQFGLLSESAALHLNKTTPGTLVGAIEDTAGKITSAVEVMYRQTTNVEAAPADQPAEL